MRFAVIAAGIGRHHARIHRDGAGTITCRLGGAAHGYGADAWLMLGATPGRSIRTTPSMSIWILEVGIEQAKPRGDVINVRLPIRLSESAICIFRFAIARAFGLPVAGARRFCLPLSPFERHDV